MGMNTFLGSSNMSTSQIIDLKETQRQQEMSRGVTGSSLGYGYGRDSTFSGYEDINQNKFGNS